MQRPVGVLGETKALEEAAAPSKKYKQQASFANRLHEAILGKQRVFPIVINASKFLKGE